ncbi:hypothetical protein QM012_005815 [Aureobasidium pullulans]|uniref:REJ domain-containing protein n=1 Tax=Aureobasidium pullulans TaxID=5580 RepID=A0ABR0TR72_AURPU
MCHASGGQEHEQGGYFKCLQMLVDSTSQNHHRQDYHEASDIHALEIGYPHGGDHSDREDFFFNGKAQEHFNQLCAQRWSVQVIIRDIYSKSSDSASSSRLATTSLTASSSSKAVASVQPTSKSSIPSSDKLASFSSSDKFSSSKTSSTTSEFPTSSAGDDQVSSKTSASTTNKPSSKLSSISSSKTSSMPTSKSSSKSPSASSSKTSSTSTKKSSTTSRSSSKTTSTTSETASTRPYPPEGPLYTPNTNACASRTARSSTSTSTRSRTSSTLSSSRTAMKSSLVSLSSRSTASSSAKSSSTPRFSLPSNSTMSSSTTTDPSATSTPAVNRFSFDDSSTNDTNDTSSTDDATSTNITTSLLNFTPNQPFLLQSLCTSDLQISGLYATLIPTASNPTLQFTSSASLATLFSLSTSGYLYILPSSFSHLWQSYSNEKLLANIDQNTTEMDLFFNEQDEIDAFGAEKASCGVDEDGLLQCKMNTQTQEVLYCEGEGTVKLAGCVLEGCDAAELAVVYV